MKKPTVHFNNSGISIRDRFDKLSRPGATDIFIAIMRRQIWDSSMIS